MALLVELSLFRVAEEAAPWLKSPDRPKRHRSTELTILQPPPLVDPELDPPEPPPEPELQGQIVEIAPPREEQVPDEYEYLAEYDNKVDEETRADRFKVNPEILAPAYSDESKMQQEDVADLNIDKPSTGARAGSARFDPGRDGNYAALPSPWAQTNKDGLQDPVPASHSLSDMAGAPQNDKLDEKVGDQVSLNTKEYLYAGYLMRVRRMVNFYWEQCVQNLPSSTRFGRNEYSTAVEAVLDGVGALETIGVTHESGSAELDACVVQSFRVAGPYPNPPEGLIEADGRVYLPPMVFDVSLGVARMQYQGVDPRAGVQFPGILKSPR